MFLKLVISFIEAVTYRSSSVDYFYLTRSANEVFHCISVLYIGCRDLEIKL